MNQLITLPRLLWLSVAICSILSIDGYAANESLTSWTQSDGPHFIYVDGNGHLNQIWYTLDSGVWSAQDLKATLGGELPPPGGTAPPPPPGPTPTPTPTTSRQYGPSSYATFLLTGLTTDPTTGFVTAGTLASQQAFPFDAGQRIIVLAAAPVTFSKFQFASATLASS